MALMHNLKAQMLWDCIEKEDLSGVVNLLQKGDINLEERDLNGQTFLMTACQAGDVSIVKELLDSGLDPNGVDNDNWSALMFAAKNGAVEISIELLETGASLEHRDLFGWTPLMWASYKGHVILVQEFLERGADPNVKAEYNMSCLSWAAGRGHLEVVKSLLLKGARANSADKYGTTPLIWACRKGYTEIVKALLNEGAHVDVTGMDSLTAILVATKGGYTDVVTALLEHEPNVNATDKDGFTALTIAAKEGYADICQELLAKDAYVNIADRAGDTILIHAVKGGYVDIVRALLNRYADLDVEGTEGKTALYWAVEKGHTEIVRLLLDNDPDIEVSNKDGDTPLMRAVRNRNELCVRLLLDKKAKVGVYDKKGDTALHISLRARSKRITELLLRNPRNSRLLYRPNKDGETPYSIDAYHQKQILTQIHGHRQLNASDGENLLGYEIYGSALADILSEPTLNTPITVGLYAKWGSGKSFLLGRLKAEMKSFTKANMEDSLEFSWSLFIILLLINSLIGSVLALAVRWEAGIGVGFGLFLVEYAFLGIIWVCSTKYMISKRISQALGKRLQIVSLLLQVMFCNPSTRTSTNDVPLVNPTMSSEHRDIKLGLSSVFDWSVWRANEKHTERTLNTFAKKQSRFHSEYENVSAAYDTVIAFLQSALPEKRLECMRKFRSILESNPKHLNALTDMINSKLVSESEKKKYVSAFTKDLNHDERHIIVGKACLELGMALVELEQIVDFELTYDQLDKKVLFSQKSRNPVYHIEEIDNQLRSHLQFEIKNEQEEVRIADTYATLFTWTQASIMRDRQMQAVCYLSEGIKRVGDTLLEDELLVWKYYQAKAYKQLQFKSHRTGFQKHLHKKWTTEAIQIFYDVINGTDRKLNENKKEILTTNKARSYVYIGEILHKLLQTEDRSYYDQCIQNPDFDELLDTPSLAFERAKLMQPKDITVLVRYGKHLLEYPSGAPKTPEQEKNDIDKSLALLADAIEQDESYWFAHSVRMTALKKKYKQNPAETSLLRDAERDGEFCFSFFPTVGSMCEYSRILYWLCDPNKKGGKNINHDYLHKSIDVLITIDSKFQNHNSALVYKQRANCHNKKTEVKEALMYIELAFYANTGPKVSVGLIQLCNYFIDVIEREKIEKCECAFAFRRLKTALATLLQTYPEQIEKMKCEVSPQDVGVLEQDLEVAKETFCSDIWKKHQDDCGNSIKGRVNDVLFYLKKETKQLKREHAQKPKCYQNLLESMFAYKVLIRVSEWIDSLSKKYIDQQTTMQSTILDEAEMFVSPETYVPSPEKYRQPYNQTGKGYDFFVLHSNKDNDFVICCLLQQLEYGQYGFKGCVPERDFEAGKTMQDNIMDKLDDSNKILIVISRKTPKAFFEYLVKPNILQSSHGTENDYRDVYVLSVGVEERPQQLLHFPYIKCGPLPLDLNEVRDVLALPRRYGMPRVYIQPLREGERLIDLPSAKCTVDEERKFTASSILELGIPQQRPIYDTDSQVESAKTILKYGLPESDALVFYEKHVVCFDKQKRLAKWVAYKLAKNDIEGPGNRRDCRFQTDTRIPDDMQPSPSAFKGNITRGHMVPAADFKASQSAMRDTFKVTNIYCEMNNNKMWSAVEVYIREKVLKDFPEIWIYIIPAFKSNDSNIVVYQRVGIRGTAVPTHMYKFVIATSDSGDGTLVTGAFVVRNKEGYGSEEMKEENKNEFQRFVEENVRTDIKTVTKDTGIQFDEILKSNGHEYNEKLLDHCKFITVDEYRGYEEKHKNQNIAKKQKAKVVRKSAE